MTYLTNLWAAFCGVPIYTIKIKEVLKKDPNGMMKRDLALMRKYSKTKPYEVGDSLELVAYKQGQADLINMVESKMVAPRTRKLL